ncbi:hypothetical protein [Streptomyces sp. NPDC059271]|uniref:hypothetical protein n=1 Tax=Streptomyces sp. NPDC059271 TaxID=3346799 RepID=UPI00367F9CCC
MRTVNLLVALALSVSGAGVLAGCGTEKATGNDGEVHRTGSLPARVADRALRVADAWDDSEAAAMWRKGYYPMGEVIQPPQDLHHDDMHAYETGNFDLAGDLPPAPPKVGRATWESGGSLTLPLVDPQKAYQATDRASSPGPRLVVTGAKLGAMTVATSRGPATVPAWLFTLQGYATPLRRAAVNPSKLPHPPIEPARGEPTDVLTPLGGLSKVAADGRSVTVVATHGSCDNGPAVEALETGGSVVLSASVVGSKDGICTSEMLGRKVTIHLKRPVGERMLLDASTGRPVPYSEWPRTSPSWS